MVILFFQYLQEQHQQQQQEEQQQCHKEVKYTVTQLAILHPRGGLCLEFYGIKDFLTRNERRIIVLIV